MKPAEVAELLLKGAALALALGGEKSERIAGAAAEMAQRGERLRGQVQRVSGEDEDETEPPKQEG